MFAELIQAIGDLKAESLKASVTAFDRTKDRALFKTDGSYEVVSADIPDRAHSAGDLNNLQAIVEKHAGADGAHGPEIEVWYNRAGVTVLFDANQYRRNKCTMPLEFSAEIRRLGEVAGKPLTQNDIIKLLRVHFRVCDFGQTVATLRNVKFEINQSGEMSVERTKTSIGKSQLAKIYGLDALLEELTFTIPVFASKFRQYFNVSAALDPDPETKTFTITPYPGQIEAAIDEAEQAIGLDLDSRMPETVKCFLGTP